MDYLHRASEKLYVGLSREGEIASPKERGMRRDIMEIKNRIDNENCPFGYRLLYSGSKREGFRLESSDSDIMFWPKSHKVICDSSQGRYYNFQNSTLILMESDHKFPGYVLLQLLNDSNKPDVIFACFHMNSGRYISSSTYCNIMCSFLGGPGSVPHGPCFSTTLGKNNFDLAFCFKSDFWPTQALPWIGRCENWPPPHMVRDIISGGCHVVPIGHRSSLYEKTEWRISFSHAEHKVVDCLSHCQFLCFILLKMFLKEVLKKETKELPLCSYHMKTVLFWVIQKNIIPEWYPQNLLECFQICFETFINYIYHGVCPNFFIPENNMFFGKVYGNVQHNLYQQLVSLKRMWPSCLLLSPSMEKQLRRYSNFPIPFDLQVRLPEPKFDCEYFFEIFAYTCYQIKIIFNPIKSLQALEKILKDKNFTFTKYQKTFMQVYASEVFRILAFETSSYCGNASNKSRYLLEMRSDEILRLSRKFGFLSTSLYEALFLYQTNRYRKAVKVLECLKIEMFKNSVIYRYTIDDSAYAEAVKELPWSIRLNRNVVTDIVLDSDLIYLSELSLEQEASKKNILPAIGIPPFVMLYFLLVLCYRRVNARKARGALADLFSFLNNDVGEYVPSEFRNISWQILGICQELTDHKEAALVSYKKAVEEEIQVNQISEAAIKRIDRIQSGQLY
ncbi:uncharacterized protein LOC134232168 [Saccostrea cucullata]|uniref:uncharacterized protein LOC134232168 n=1 Tax=Saccostrea cuccullata TaxID=36930 RepID=UPI002ECFB658